MALLVGALPSVGGAQVPESPVGPVHAVLQRLGSADGSLRMEMSWTLVSALREDPSQFSEPYLRSLMDGLEELAIKEEGSLVASDAVSHLLLISRELHREMGLPVVPRLIRIFEQAESIGQMGLALGAMTRGQKREMPEAIEFLSEVATRETDLAFPTVNTVAVAALARAGEPGVRALKEMLRADRVKDPSALKILREMAAKDFRVGGGSD